MTYARTESSRPVPRQPYEIRRIGGGQDMAVTLEEAKQDLRVDSSDDDVVVQRLVRGMTDFFESRTGWRLSPAQYELLVGGCGPTITVERGPFRELLGCWYWDCETRTWEVIALDQITVVERGREFDLVFTDAAVRLFPVPTALRPLPIRIQFEAGFDSPEVTQTTVKGPPEDGMLLSLLALVALGYEEREAGKANGAWTGADPSKDYLLAQYRKFW